MNIEYSSEKREFEVYGYCTQPCIFSTFAEASAYVMERLRHFNEGDEFLKGQQAQLLSSQGQGVNSLVDPFPVPIGSVEYAPSEQEQETIAEASR